jgi:salicylate hydroxylase
VAAGRLVSFAATVPSEDQMPESWSAKAEPAELAAAYSGWHSEVGQVIAAAGEVHRWALHDRDGVGTWRTKRIALIGDAAHPMLPFLAQGANQAIEDAAVLARCLRGSPTSHYALERYESTRRPRVDRVHQISRRNAVMLHLADSDEQRERDAELRITQRLGDQQWLYGYDALTA